MGKDAPVGHDAVSFVRELMEALNGHQPEHRRRPHLAEGAMYMPGLMLSRLAVEAAMALPSDLPYLPTRFAKGLDCLVTVRESGTAFAIHASPQLSGTHLLSGSSWGLRTPVESWVPKSIL